MERTARPDLDRKGASPMAETQSRPRLVRFGAFEADVRTGELRKDGVKAEVQRAAVPGARHPAGAPWRRSDTGRTAKASLAGHVCGCRAQPKHRRQQDPGSARRLGGEPALYRRLCRGAAIGLLRPSSLLPRTSPKTRSISPSTNQKNRATTACIPGWQSSVACSWQPVFSLPSGSGLPGPMARQR